LAIVLYTAGMNGRLIWHSAAEFMVLQPPSGTSPQLSRNAGRAALLRAVDHFWEILVFIVPPGMMLMVSGLLAIGWRENAAISLLAILLVLGGIIYVATLLGITVIRGASDLLRRLDGWQRPGLLTRESLLDMHWSVPLVHMTDSGKAVGMLEEAQQRTIDLNTAATANDRELVVYHAAGITTSAARHAMVATARLQEFVVENRAFLVHAPPEFRPKKPDIRHVTGGLSILIVGVAMIVAVQAQLIAEGERDACVSADCQGRPTSFGSALIWLAGRLVLSDTTGLDPVTVQAQIYGLLAPLMTLTVIVCTFVAGRRYTARMHDARRDLYTQVTPARSAEPKPTRSTPPKRLQMGFAVDVVGYGARPAPVQEEVQRRLRALVADALAVCHVPVEGAKIQWTGDGANVFLPTDIDPTTTLPKLIKTTTELLAEDNRRHDDDPIQLRMGVGVGIVGVGAAGYAGSMVVEINRLVDSRSLRQAVADHPRADLVVLVSDHVHAYIVRPGYLGALGEQFRSVDVSEKEFRERAWLWVSPSPAPGAE
jgi:hypothetical protein